MSGIMTSTIFIALPMGESGYLDAHPVLGITIIAIVAILVSVGIALLTERIAYRPLRGNHLHWPPWTAGKTDASQNH